MRTVGDEEIIKRIKRILSKIEEPTTGLDLITGDYIKEIKIEFTKIEIKLKSFYPDYFSPSYMFIKSYILNSIAKKIVDTLNREGFTEVEVVSGKEEI
ncbi:MAG: hypothetical protein QMD25_06470 [Caldisericia bacterium]|jgi:hypothetical protein|nr:hypothetical protein [Caldisericia bacterium]